MSTQWCRKDAVIDAVRWTGDNLAEVEALAPGSARLVEARPGGRERVRVRRPGQQSMDVPHGGWVFREHDGELGWAETDDELRAFAQPMTAEPEPGPVVLQFELSNKGAGAIATQLARQIVSALPQPQPQPQAGTCDRAHADDRADGAVVVWAEDLRLYFGSLAGTLRGGDLAKAEGARRRLREAAGL